MGTVTNVTDSLACGLWNIILTPIIGLLVALSVVIFVFGIVEFLAGISSNADNGKREIGRNHMIAGLIGIAIMLSATSIFNIIKNTVGSDVRSPNCRGK